MFSAFNPSEWSSGQLTVWCPGSSWGFVALLKSLPPGSWCSSWCRKQVRNLQRRRGAFFRIIGNWLIPIVLIVRGSTRRHRRDLNQNG